MVVVTLKVTEVPAQMILPGDAVIDAVGVTVGITVIVMVLLVTSVGLAQAALLVRSQVITSPLANVLSIYVPALVPTGLPFLYHW